MCMNASVSLATSKTPNLSLSGTCTGGSVPGTHLVANGGMYGVSKPAILSQKRRNLAALPESLCQLLVALAS